MDELQSDCRFFSGYKPCGKNKICDSHCPFKQVVGHRILIVHLGALGAVVRSTSLLAAIRRKYSRSHITWVTDEPAHKLLESHPLIDRVLTTSPSHQLILRVLDFDVALVIDKCLKSQGVLRIPKVREVYGFLAHPKTAAIVPATKAAERLWQLGLSDEEKFFKNNKPETQLLIEALELGPFRRDTYDLPLSDEEIQLSVTRRRALTSEVDQPVIGLNTGCSEVIAAKRWTESYWLQVIQELGQRGFENIALLGGPEDLERNRRLAEKSLALETPCDLGLRDGLVSVEACDIVITGDSLGMHMAIARGKWVTAWFGPTCAHEIDLYDRGIVLQSPCLALHAGSGIAKSLKCAMTPYLSTKLSVPSTNWSRGGERMKTRAKELSKNPSKTIWNSFDFKILRILRAHEIRAQTLILAVSGGADSVALLLCLSRLAAACELDLHVAHIHHGDGDGFSAPDINNFREASQKLVENICRELQIPFHTIRREKNKISGAAQDSEESLRDFRYGYLEGLRNELRTERSARMENVPKNEWRYGLPTSFSLPLVVTAHHQDDLLESRLMRMLRGSGIEGLRSMSFKNSRTLRPFLTVTRMEIENYLREMKQVYMTDPQSSDLRSFLRKTWLPLIDKRLPGAVNAMGRSLELILDQASAETDLEFSEALKVWIQEGQIERSAFELWTEKRRKRGLRHFLKGLGVRNYTQGHIHEILKNLDKDQTMHMFKIAGLDWQVDANFIRAST